MAQQQTYYQPAQQQNYQPPQGSFAGEIDDIFNDPLLDSLATGGNDMVMPNNQGDRRGREALLAIISPVN